MNRPTTAREALMAELITDMGQLADRLESFYDRLPQDLANLKGEIVDAAESVESAAKAMDGSTDRLVAAWEKFETGSRTALDKEKERLDAYLQARTGELVADKHRALTSTFKSDIETVSHNAFKGDVEESFSKLLALVERAGRVTAKGPARWLELAGVGLIAGGTAAFLTYYLH